MNSEYMIKRNENIVARKIHDTYFLINIADNYTYDICVLYQINEIGFFIWNNINGEKTCTDLADRLKHAINEDIDYQIILQDVIKFLSELKKRDFIKS